MLFTSFGAYGAAERRVPGWPDSIAGDHGFADLGHAISRESGFPRNGSDIDKARYVYQRLPEMARTYGLKAGSGSVTSSAVIGVTRWGSDPENADSLKKWPHWGNCGEWSWAFSEVLGGAGVVSHVVYGDKTGGSGRSYGFTGTDTTLFIEERTPDGKISRRVFDAFRAAYHGTNWQPTLTTLAQWGDLPLTDNDKLPKDRDRNSWQRIVGKPYIKDARTQAELDPVAPRSRLPVRSAEPSSGYCIFLLINASNGLYLGTEEALRHRVKCSFEGGGVGCKSTDLVAYQKLLGPFRTLADAQSALCRSITKRQVWPLGIGLKGQWQNSDKWYGLWDGSVTFACR